MTDQPTTHSRESLPELDAALAGDYLKSMPGTDVWATVVPGRSPVLKVHSTENLARKAYRLASRYNSPYHGVRLLSLRPDGETGELHWFLVQEFKRGVERVEDATDYISATYGITQYSDGVNTAWYYKNHLVILDTGRKGRRDQGTTRIFLDGRAVATSVNAKHMGRGTEDTAREIIVKKHDDLIRWVIRRIDFPSEAASA